MLLRLLSVVRNGRCLIAAEIYKRENGIYPEGLAELGLPKEVTQDPFTEEEFIYNLVNEKILIYSDEKNEIIKEVKGSILPDILHMGEDIIIIEEANK